MKTTSAQDIFLNTLRKDKTQVAIHLTNGYQIRGIIKGFDAFIIIMDSEGKQIVIYKHAISTVSPLNPVRFDLIGENE